MRDGADDLTRAAEYRAAQPAAGQVFLHDGRFMRDGGKMRVSRLQLVFRARDAVARLGVQAELFAADGLDDARQRRARKKRVLTLVRCFFIALRHGHAKPSGQRRDGGFVIEKPELLGRGDAQAAHGRKPRLFAREHRQRLRADGQKRRFFAAFLCLFAAEVI